MASTGGTTKHLKIKIMATYNFQRREICEVLEIGLTLFEAQERLHKAEQYTNYLL